MSPEEYVDQQGRKFKQPCHYFEDYSKVINRLLTLIVTIIIGTWVIFVLAISLSTSAKSESEKAKRESNRLAGQVQLIKNDYGHTRELLSLIRQDIASLTKTMESIKQQEK